MQVDPIRNDQYNIGYICTTLQCENGLGSKLALKFVSHNRTTTSYTFRDLDMLTNQCANLLIDLGLKEGDVVFTLLPKIPEQFAVFLGALKAKCIVGTLFSSFGESSIMDRLADSRAACLITKASLYRKIETARASLPFLRKVVLVDSSENISNDVLSYGLLLKKSRGIYSTPITPPKTPSILHYTSGSTGKPKGVQHVHEGILHLFRTTAETLSLKEDDIFWCSADQGWVTGTSYGIIGPWSHGITQIHYGGRYDPKEWFELLVREQINVWYTSPTALRMIMQRDDPFFAKFDLSRLRYIFSVGEPLNPEILNWSRRVLKRDIYDTWFQTETGGIMIGNRPGLEIRPGSMGKPCGDIVAEIRSSDGTRVKDGKSGNLCIRSGWPSMFTGYLNNERTYIDRFRDGYYYSGDQAYRDMDGYFWFSGRNDDIINTAGHLIGPFEVESVLLELPEIVDVAVIGVPDDLLYEKIIAYIVLRQGVSLTKDLELSIRIHANSKLSSLAIPQEIIRVDSIPKSKSGKVMRRVMKSQYLGLEPGDLTSLED
jgi:acetyl-CoA synthetase